MASDQLVSAKDILAALAELRRRGHDPLLQDLEKREPDLAEFLMEEMSNIHRKVEQVGLKPRFVRRLSRQIEAMALVLLTSLHNAHLRLWTEDAADSPLATLDPPTQEGDQRREDG